MALYRPVTVLTGASSGIGAALARVFAEHGHELALVARREAELTALAEEIAAGNRKRPLVLPIDLSRSDAPARISHELIARGLEPAFVINNAGFGLAGAATALDRAEQLAMIDLNVRTLTDMSLRWVESLTRHRGGILNVASVAGFLSGPNCRFITPRNHMCLRSAKPCTWNQTARGAGDGAGAWSAVDRVPGASRNQRQAAAPAHVLAREGRARRISRPDTRPAV